MESGFDHYSGERPFVHKIVKMHRPDIRHDKARSQNTLLVKDFAKNERDETRLLQK